MRNTIITALTLALSLGVAACDDKKADAKKDEKKADATKKVDDKKAPADVKTPPPVEAKADGGAPPADGGDLKAADGGAADGAAADGGAPPADAKAPPADVKAGG
jgi:hypothetical protein